MLIGTGKLSNWKHFSSLGPVGEPVESFDKGELNCILKPKYIVVIATALAAVITPSTDPVTQILMASALLALYVGGSGIVLLLEK